MGKPKAPPPPDYAGLAKQQGEANIQNAQFEAGINRPTEVDPYGSRTWTLRPGADPKNPQPGDYVVSTSLNPAQQGLLDSQNQISQSFLNTGIAGLDRVSDTMAQPFDPSSAGAMGRLSTEGLPGIDASNDQSRLRVEEAMMSRLQPQLDRQRQALDTRLTTSGHELGSEAWQQGMNLQNQAEIDARMQAILGGGAEEDRILANQRATRGQLFGEQSDVTGFNNDARTQLIQELLMQRQLPLNEANALRTGAQVGQFTPANFYTPQSQAAPLFDAGLAQGNYDLQSYQNKLSGSNALLGGLANLGSSAIMKWSDRRLKTNIQPAGEKWGLPWYTWDWKDGTGSSEGVMADEVEAVMPEAVVQFGDYKAVRYDMLEHRHVA